jgi:hypothetical protein
MSDTAALLASSWALARGPAAHRNLSGSNLPSISTGGAAARSPSGGVRQAVGEGTPSPRASAAGEADTYYILQEYMS